MPKETDITRLEARIVELENALKAITALTQPVDLSADEIKAYLKVRDAISCRICRCSFVCSCRCPERCRCDKVCSCHIWGPTCGYYPCDIGYSGTSGFERFTDLGS